MYKFKNKIQNVKIISKWILAILFILTFLEIFIFPEFENVYGCFTFIIAWGFLSVFVMNQQNVNKCFLPFLALFGLGICFFFLPLLITMIEGKPLTFRFQCPTQTFNYQLINLLMLILAYRVCLNVYKSQNILSKLWSKLGYFTPPTDKQIWAMGIIGVLSQIFLLLIMGTDEARAENLGFWGHLLGVTKNFACFPVLLLFKNLYNINERSKPNKKNIILYLIILLTLGLATGKRTAIFSYLVTIAMCYVVPIFTENRRIFSHRTLLIGFICIYLVTGPIADLAAAMALGRDNSERTSSSETFQNIIELYQDKERLNAMYKTFLMTTDNAGDNLSGWSEYYVDNIMMDRFCNLRVCDMSIDYANKLGFNNPIMHRYFKNQLLFTIPTPFLEILGIYVNKFKFQYTPGDLMSMESLNIGHYHGYRVAGDVGIGLYLWGDMYFIYAFFIYFAFFYFLSSIVCYKEYAHLIFPLPILVDLFRYFLLFNNSTGIVGVCVTLLRTGWQVIVVYCIILLIIKKVIK